MPAALLTRGYIRNHNVTFRDENYSVAKGSGIWQLAPTLAALCNPENFHHFFDDFLVTDLFDGSLTYAVTADAGGAQDYTDAAGGVFSLKCDGDDNDEAYLATTWQNWLFAASKPLYFEARVKLTEANTDDANIFVGFQDSGGGANSLLDNGGGPPASYDGAGWFKIDGGTVWQFETSNAGTQSTTTSAGAFSSATWTRLGLIFDPDAGTTGIVTPYLNGAAGTTRNITLSGLEEMNLVLGVKAGGANEETLLIDYVRILQVR